LLEASDQLTKQITFIMEIDKLKTILRRTMLTDKSRYENTGEHSWHLAMMALFLHEHANSHQVDVNRVIRMVLIHDIVEIDAGDTFVYDVTGQADKAEREEAAAARIFGLLPVQQRDELYSLWHEFEARETPEAQFAAALDRLHPLLHNYYTEGAAWREHGIKSSQVYDRNKHIAEGSEVLWQFAQSLIRSSVEKGYLAP
jgi:putative hydrolase of HD superfamily